MARQNFAKNSLNAGEFSPRLRGRTDIDKYFNAVGRMKNWLPLPFGGAQKTPGTVFVNDVRNSSAEVRIFDWVFGSRQAYILQFNDGKIRFYKDRGTIAQTVSLTITGITNANPGVVTAASHGLSNGDRITLEGIDGMTEVNGVEYRVKNAATDTFELGAAADNSNVNTSAYGVFILASATKLLLHLNVDLDDASASNHTVTAVGDAAVSADQAKFGSKAVYLDGSGDYLTVPDSADWSMGSGNFEIDGWFYFTDILTDNRGIFEQKHSTGNRTNRLSFSTNVNTASDPGLIWSVHDGSSQLITIYGSFASAGFVGFAANTWYHIAVVRNSNDWTLYINGTSLGTTTSSGTMGDADGAMNIGYFSGGSTFKGYIDEFRVTKGVARWTAAFTPPTQASAVGASTTAEVIYEISHVFDDDELFDIQTAQAGDIMYMAHGDNPTQKLSRFDDDNWTIANVDFQDGPYLDENSTATTLDPSDVTGSVTVTASSVTGINDGQGFLTTDVGRLIRYHDGTDWFWMKITARASTTSITATIQHEAGDPTDTTMSGHAATARWRLGAWSATTGYPRATAFFQGRLWFGGTTYQPQNIWGSQSLDYENMNPGSAGDADAITYQINSNKVNIIKWLASTKRLIVGTEGENFTVYSGTSTEPITPTNVKADPETNYGTSSVTPVKIGSYIYYVQDDDKTLREFYYDFGIDSYRSINRTILSEHMTQEGIKQMAYQKAPFGVIYCVLEDGKLVTFTREIEQEVQGWASQDITGTRSSDKFKSVAVIPVDGYDETWFAVERVINGQTKKYIEYQVNPNQDMESDFEDMVLMQCALTHEGASSTVTGLDHLEGETVHVLADGTYLSRTVASGAISLGATYQTKQIGLPVTSQIKLLPLEAGSSIGSSQGMLKKVNDIVLAVYNSLGLKAGKDGGNMEEVFRNGSGALLTTLQTGDFTVKSTLGWNAKQELLIEQTKPFPATILSINLFEFTAEEQAGKTA